MNEATRLQIDAARPESSTWLSANAGSGKTRVLTDRVARLLLGGTSPQNVLCLTYTKAAASEMQNRLFKRLGRWAMSSDRALGAQLAELGAAGPLDGETLARARRLFAGAIETPGGLRIQTIHSFCASILRRFPLESGVSPQFREMDDRAAARLRADCLEIVATDHAAVMAELALHHTGSDLDGLAAEVVARRDDFGRDAGDDALRRELGVEEIASADELLSRVFVGGEADLLARLASALRNGGKSDLKVQPVIAALAPPWTLRDLETLEGCLLFGAKAKAPFGAKIDGFPTKAVQAILGDAQGALNDLMARIEAAREPRLGLVSLARSRALRNFADIYLPLYAARKAARACLDFDDLILRARDLLTVRDVADWVLYRLDGGIDHILVDEAQDTSPTQWQVIEVLAREFMSGRGARDGTVRTLFVVGDKKQSIYSFQGADPDGFDRMHERFSAARGDGWLRRREMQHSFRSSSAILAAVDAVFGETQAFGAEVEHVAFHDWLPGRVDLWPLEEAAEAVEEPAFHDPVDVVAPHDASLRLARRIAATIRAMIASGTTVPDGPGRRRPLTEGDILILLRSRGPLFREILRACKSEGLRIAGADRLTLGTALAVRDIRTLLAFLVTPEDDLSLATALRSPLFGWTEAQLYDLAQGRGGRYLWQVLRDRAAEFPETMEVIGDLRGVADYFRPYELIERILVRHRGRDRLLGRLGPEAQDPLDALLNEALGYERADVPSLTGFLAWLDADDIEIKRQTGTTRDELRVMTIHGAKGLEAPVVVLPDTMFVREDVRQDILVTEGGSLLWKQAGDARPVAMREAIERIRTADRAERARLLYVAMTRAEHWLIVAGAGDPEKTEGTWYDAVRAGLERLSPARIETRDGILLRHQVHDWEAGDTVAPPPPAAEAEDLPAWYRDPAPIPVDAPALLTPSTLGGAKALPGEIAEEDEEAVLRRGRHLHALLEHLPADRPEDWPGLADILIGRDMVMPGSERDALLAEAAAVLSSPDLAPIFVNPALTEVDITAPGPNGRRILGTIDRLVVMDERVLAIDYKSNRTIPRRVDEVPDGLLRQMGAYAVALGALYPGRTIETALLWTSNASLLRLPTDRAIAAFRAAVELDGIPGRT